MAFEIDLRLHPFAGGKPVEDVAAAMRPEPGREAMGAIAAMTDGLYTGGFAREAAQTMVTRLVRDCFCTQETWDTTVAPDRVSGAQNSRLAGVIRRRELALDLDSTGAARPVV